MLKHRTIVLVGIIQLLLAAVTIPSAAQEATAEGHGKLECDGAYACVDPKPLSEEEARRSRGYPQPAKAQADADRNAGSKSKSVRAPRKG